MSAIQIQRLLRKKATTNLESAQLDGQPIDIEVLRKVLDRLVRTYGKQSCSLLASMYRNIGQGTLQKSNLATKVGDVTRQLQQWHAQSDFPKGSSREDVFSESILPCLVDLCKSKGRGVVDLRRLQLSLYVLGQIKLQTLVDMFRTNRGTRQMSQSFDYGMLPQLHVGHTDFDSTRLASDLIQVCLSVLPNLLI